MTKIAAKKTTNEDKANAASRAFIVALFDIGWRLAVAFLVPVIAGVAIDSKRDGQAYTIAGVIIGVVLALAVIVKLAFDINKVGK